MEKPDNKGQKRESLVILEKVDHYEGLLKSLASEGDTGIIGDRPDIERRQRFFGKNEKRLPKIKTFLPLVFEQLQDQNMKLLLIAATISLVINVLTYDKSTNPYGYLESLSIYIAAALIIFLAASFDVIKEKQFLKLHKEIKNQECSVIRGQSGLSQTCREKDLCVGDIVLIETGERIPADCILLEGTDVMVDEQIYNNGVPTVVSKTIATHENHKENPDPFILNQSLVMNGSGRAVICALGSHTRLEQDLDQEALEEQPPTPLQDKLDNIAGEIGKWGFVGGIVIFLALTVNNLIQILFSSDSLLGPTSLSAVVNNFIIGITIVIVAVPEGLPLAVSISVAFSIDKMKDDQLLVKNLESFETMGQVTEICTGKTATLTQNKMQVNMFFTGGRLIHNQKANTFNRSEIAEMNSILIKESIVYNCTARIEMSNDALYIPIGNGTESGLLSFLQQNDIPVHELLKLKVGRVLTEIPFNPIRKRMLVAIQHPEDEELVRVIVKGAPEYVISFCSGKMNEDGEVEDFSEEDQNRFLEEIVNEAMAKNGLRTFMYAYKDMHIDDFYSMRDQNNYFTSIEDRESLERDLTFLVLFGLNDPLRDGVNEAIRKLNNGKINVRMISGDNLHTAKACAVEAGILRPEEAEQRYVCMTGNEFRNLVGGVRRSVDRSGHERVEVINKQNFRQIANRLRVLARSTPEDKYALVCGLKEIDACVAVTADGINDSGALRSANVGFCMGMSGCDVAKDSADMIITNDNFNSVLAATQWGRNIYDNVRKFIQFQSTINVVTLFIVFVSSVSYGKSVFSVILLLWINLVMDVFAAVGLATEPPNSQQLRGSPVRKNDPIIIPVMWRTILGQALYQAIVLLILLYFGPLMFGFTYTMADFNDTTTAAQNAQWEHYTLIFNTFMFMTYFNEINSRKLGKKEFNIFESFLNNWLFIFILIGQCIAQFFFVELCGKVCSTYSQSTKEWATSVLFGVGSLIVAAIWKATPPEWVERINVKVNEEAVEDPNDPIARAMKASKGGVQKSETERLLDSD